MRSKPAQTSPKPVFDDIEYQPALDNDANNPINSLFKVGSPSRYNSDGWSTLIFVGAFFQFTPTDRHAWNEMVQRGILPRHEELLGASWCRATEHLPEEAYEDHMPKATRFAKGKCNKDSHTFSPHSPYYDGGPNIA